VRRILISGGTGFVGSYLVRHLKSSQAKLIVLSSEARANFGESGVDYCRVDIRNADDVQAAFRAAQPNQIYHLAGVSSVARCWDNPRLAFDVNVVGSYNVFEGALRLPSQPRILNVSTAQVYAHSSSALTETSRQAPDNPYAATKAMAELLTIQYKKCTNWGVITARAFNHTGPGQPPDFVLPSFAKQFAEMEAGLCPPVLKVGNITVKRDFTDVRDVVVAYSELLAKGTTGESYNVCSGRAILLADIVNQFQKNCNVAVKIELDSDRVRTSDVPEVVGDPRKIQVTTRWRPKIPLGTTLKDLLDYWRAAVKRKVTEDHGALRESLS
jgi:GDP-4-dehydro-6-deoxy-D-mannose reductase